MPGCEPLWLFDHKVTSNFKYAKTAMQLTEDPQALLYSAAMMILHNRKTVQSRWIYYQATSPTNGDRQPSGCKAVDFSFNAEDPLFLERIEAIEKDIRKIVMIRSLTHKINVLNYPPNPASCSMFGGCPHIERCNLSNDDKLAMYLKNF
jgi:hypothetical protein